TMNIMKGILAEVKDGKLILTGTNSLLRIEKTLELVEGEDGSTVFPAKLFSDIVRKLSDDVITVTSDERGSATISTMMSTFNIVCFSADEFPSEEQFEEGRTLRISKDVFMQMVKKTAFAASRDESRGILLGILIRSMPDSIKMVALDGFRIASARTENVMGEESELVIAAGILNELVSILSDSELENDEIVFRFNDKKAEVKTLDSRITMSLLKGTFISYENLIPKDFSVSVFVSRSSLRESVERASLLALDGRNNLVKLRFEDDELRISSQSDSGKVDEVIAIQKEGENMEIGFNSKYLLEGLKVIEDENIILKLNSSVTPCVIEPMSGNYTYLLLPVRISS
ncbi:MAG: DNA polymerase III subunit beta, partial [Solobacterium sp.]|nr:DNA polymerase III subunit beta [Solobacterium sp.]